MQILSPALRYQQALSESGYQPDVIQQETIFRLDAIWREFCAHQSGAVENRGMFTRFKQFLGKPRVTETVRGLYMWGGVGRGKTWLMDLFFESIPGERKLRLHFHRFMMKVHEALAALEGQSDPLLRVADDFKARTDIICFDEFFVSDITDAMLLGNLMQALFERGITLVATSNIPPDELYRNGLQRARFLPAIDAIKRHCDVINVDAGIDYRLRTLVQAHLWLSPLSDETEKQMLRLWQSLNGGEAQKQQTLEVNHRPLLAIGCAHQTLAVTFHTLCAQARSQVDYVALTRDYHTVLLYHVPVMGPRNESEARRFIALIDEFYERRVKLIVSAEAPLLNIYCGERLTFEFQRCLSRLQEMQSEEYLHQSYMP